jgi:hypothetical protein
MVKGLKIFQEHFKKHTHQFVLIGGTACDLAMEEAGLDFRGTKDLDIVLCLEALDKDFATAFWEFVQAGGYQIQEKSTGEKIFYRFCKPENKDYPFMLELFSRVPDAISIGDDRHLAPIPVDEEALSLSAILLNDDYYHFLHAGKKEIQGVPIVTPAHLIPLKARAWLDLSERKEKDDSIDSKDIRKHKNDIFRLFRIIDPEIIPDIPEEVKNGMKQFLDKMESEEIDLKSLDLTGQDKGKIIDEMRRIYGVGT